MSKNDSYQSLREVLISLTVENDDKDHVVNLLKQKCAIKTDELGKVQNEVSQTYEDLLRVRCYKRIQIVTVN